VAVADKEVEEEEGDKTSKVRHRQIDTKSEPKDYLSVYILLMMMFRYLTSDF
jgi:hypothetical protein